jgi:chromosome segregation protein
MMMRLSHIEVAGFRGYSKPVRISFAKRFTILDGRNGVGKSSVFDAIEFALLGKLTKYEDAKADRESADDYIWWRGEGVPPEQRYVEVGFVNGGELRTVRRSMLQDPSPQELSPIFESLVIRSAAPNDAISQLLKNSIIRDEHIAALSLDLKETQRYQVLCDAIGALGSDEWIQKSAKLLSEAQRRAKAAELEVQSALANISSWTSRLAQLDAAIVGADQVREAATALRDALGENLEGSALLAKAQAYVSGLGQQANQLRRIAPQLNQSREDDLQLGKISESTQQLNDELQSQSKSLEEVTAQLADQAGSISEQFTADVAAILTLGRRIGLQDDECPVCSSRHTQDSFSEGLEKAEGRLGFLREKALAQAALQQQRQGIANNIAEIKRRMEDLALTRTTLASRIDSVRNTLQKSGLGEAVDLSLLSERAANLEGQAAVLGKHVSTLQSLSFAATRESAAQSLEDTRAHHIRAEERLGIARRAEERAKTLHDAARRAAGDTLNSRLDQILPLTSELYRRLRPHPVWDDITYKLRGDVQRFLKLEVGDEVNPQFVFSSGQRRATGLAFLLSVYLSLSWSKLNTLMLDDPVQHIDDFRSIHLAEVLSEVVSSGRQVICAAEDAALADLLARHLPVNEVGDGKRISLGVGEDGRLDILADRAVLPMPRGTFLPLEFKSAI